MYFWNMSSDDVSWSIRALLKNIYLPSQNESSKILFHTGNRSSEILNVRKQKYYAIQQKAFVLEKNIFITFYFLYFLHKSTNLQEFI